MYSDHLNEYECMYALKYLHLVWEYLVCEQIYCRTRTNQERLQAGYKYKIMFGVHLGLFSSWNKLRDASRAINEHRKIM